MLSGPNQVKPLECQGVDRYMGTQQVVASSAEWIVARAKSGRESWAVENVRKQGYTPYQPLTPWRRRANLLCSRPLFGPYFFVKSFGAWRFLLGTFGVAGVVLFGETPATVRNYVIDNLKAREIDGIVELPQLPADTERWKLGARLRVKGGVFSGNIGIYEGMDLKARERVLLDFLGRKTSVLIAPEMLEAA